MEIANGYKDEEGDGRTLIKPSAIQFGCHRLTGITTLPQASSVC